MPQFIIRNAETDDLPAIVAIYNETIPGRMVTADLEPVTAGDKMAWFRAHDHHTRPLWVAMDNDEMAGWASFQSFYGRPAYRHTAEISIYISEKYRQQGLGQIFLEKAIAAASGIEITNLLGFIFGHNEPSLRLFRKYGFETWANLPGVALMDGVWRDLVILGLKVG